MGKRRRDRQHDLLEIGHFTSVPARIRRRRNADYLVIGASTSGKCRGVVPAARPSIRETGGFPCNFLLPFGALSSAVPRAICEVRSASRPWHLGFREVRRHARGPDARRDSYFARCGRRAQKASGKKSWTGKSGGCRRIVFHEVRRRSRRRSFFSRSGAHREDVEAAVPCIFRGPEPVASTTSRTLRRLWRSDVTRTRNCRHVEYFF